MQAQNNHTPGEWTKHPQNGRVIMCGETKIATAHTFGLANQSEAWANANLFTAAPDMLVALQEFIECGNTTETKTLAFAAIAKAKGTK